MLQESLFAQNLKAPLAERLRPKSLEDYVGQAHIVGKDGLLAKAIAQKTLFSMLLWGPPGCGKTSLALLLAGLVDAEFVRLSAVFSGVKEVREAVARAQERRFHGRKTLLFIDEIHRFNKSQQDAFLPYVEDGTIILIGATTENPSFNINNALLSRLKVFHLKQLSEEDIYKRLKQVLDALNMKDLEDEESLRLLAYQASGDLRRALNFLEEWLLLIKSGKKNTEALQEVLRDLPKAFDKQGDLFYELLSAFHKSLRGSSPDGAMYWFARMVEAGGDPLVICRRMLCVASEDIGNADLNALNLALNTYQTVERLGAPEGYLAMAQCINYLALAPKSNASYLAMKKAFAYVRANPAHAVPKHLCNAPTDLQKKEGYGKEYRYAHDEPMAYSAGQTYLPEEMKDIVFYQPNERGLEIKLKEKLERLRLLDEDAVL